MVGIIIIIIIAAGTHIHYYGIIILYRCVRLLRHTRGNNIMHTTVGMRTVTYTPRMLPNIKKKTYLLSRYYTFIHTVAAGRLRNRFCQLRARRRFVTLRRSTV